MISYYCLLALFVSVVHSQRSTPFMNVLNCLLGTMPVNAACCTPGLATCWVCGTRAQAGTANIPASSVGLYLGTTLPATTVPPVNNVPVIYFGQAQSARTAKNGLSGELLKQSNVYGFNLNYMCWMITNNFGNTLFDQQPAIVEALILSGFILTGNSADHLGTDGINPLRINRLYDMPSPPNDIAAASIHIMNVFGNILTRIGAGNL